MNEVLMFAEIAIFFSGILLIKKFLGKSGIYAWISIATLLAELQLCKSVILFGISSTLGNVLFASTFLCTDILRECYGQEEAKKGPFFSLLGVGVYVIFCVMTLLFIPSENDISQRSFEILCTLSIRITFASVLMLFISNKLDVFIYDKLYKKTNGKFMWLRNNITTIICNCGENFCFYLLAFTGEIPFSEMMIYALSASIIEIIVAICDTPFLYLSKKVK